MSDVVQLLQTAYPKSWENHLRNLGVSAQADLPPVELARFTEHVFWLVRQTGIKDPAAWLAHRTRLEAPAAPVAPVELKASGENTGDITVQRGSVELPAKPGVDSAKTSDASQPMTATVPSGSTQTELLPRAKAATSGTKGPKTQTNPLGATGHKRGRSGSRQLEKQKLPAGISNSARKLSPERMRIVLDTLREYPILSRAADKAGIHRKTLEYWVKCSKAGHDGYDIEWQGLTWRFHELCQSAIDEAHDRLLDGVLNIAMGVVIFETDPFLVDLGCQGADAYAKDENGNFIVEAVGPRNPKMMRFFLELVRPEKWGKNRKIDVWHEGGVLVVGDVTKKPEYSMVASVKPGSGSRVREGFGSGFLDCIIIESLHNPIADA